MDETMHDEHHQYGLDGWLNESDKIHVGHDKPWHYINDYDKCQSKIVTGQFKWDQPIWLGWSCYPERSCSRENLWNYENLMMNFPHKNHLPKVCHEAKGNVPTTESNSKQMIVAYLFHGNEIEICILMNGVVFNGIQNVSSHFAIHRYHQAQHNATTIVGCNYHSV